MVAVIVMMVDLLVYISFTGMSPVFKMFFVPARMMTMSTFCNARMHAQEVYDILGSSHEQTIRQRLKITKQLSLQ